MTPAEVLSFVPWMQHAFLIFVVGYGGRRPDRRVFATGMLSPSFHDDSICVLTFPRLAESAIDLSAWPHSHLPPLFRSTHIIVFTVFNITVLLPFSLTRPSYRKIRVGLVLSLVDEAGAVSRGWRVAVTNTTKAQVAFELTTMDDGLPPQDGADAPKVQLTINFQERSMSENIFFHPYRNSENQASRSR